MQTGLFKNSSQLRCQMTSCRDPSPSTKAWRKDCHLKNRTVSSVSTCPTISRWLTSGARRDPDDGDRREQAGNALDAIDAYLTTMGYGSAFQAVTPLGDHVDVGDYDPWRRPAPKRDFILSLGFALQRANVRMLRGSSLRRRRNRAKDCFASGSRSQQEVPIVPEVLGRSLVRPSF
eukprot:COSAG02_NODE_7447_length_3009_cov_2.201375_1_plen_176_part_00